MQTNPEQEPLIVEKDYEYENEQNLDSLINAKIRKGFIIKVYSILLIQLLSTSVFIFFAYHSTSFYKFVYESYLFFFLSIIILIACLVVVSCFSYILQKFPHNYIFLTIFTLTESYFIASFVCQYTGKSVLIALLLTLTTVVTLTTYAYFTKTDITVYGGVFFCLLSLSFVCSIILIFVKVKIVKLIYDIFVLLLFAGYLIYDTQLIVKSDSKFQFSTDDYILASLNLYLDIINIFIQFLGIFGEQR